MAQGAVRLAAFVFAVAALGCAGGGSHSHPLCPAMSGIALLSWTIKNQPTTPTTCAGVDHLVLDLSTSCGTLEIEPIPCVQGAHWEYDQLPEGEAFASLVAVDARGVLVYQGSGSTALTTQKPSAPTPIDLE